MQEDECCAKLVIISIGMMGTQWKGPSPSLMESGMVSFGSWGWRTLLDRKNEIDHFHFWPRWSNRDSCQDCETGH